MQTPKYHTLLSVPKEFPKMRMNKLCRNWLFALISVFILNACGQGESNVERGNREGILYKGNGIEPQTLDPHTATGVPEHHILAALFEGLVAKDPATLEIVPGVAESWTISDDGKIYTFKLQPNAKWSNGDVLTAHDFVWSWWRGLQPQLGNQYVFMYFPVKNAEDYFKGEISDWDQVGIKALDDTTLQIELRNPTPYFLQLLDHYSTFPVHRSTIEKWGAPDESYTRWTRPENIVSNGPFKLDEWRLNKVLSVSRNENYWDIDRVSLNGVRFYPIESPTVEERMYRAGQLHFTNTGVIDRLPYYRENNPQALRIAPYLGTYMYRLNTRLEYLKDKRVRKALAMTIDRDTLTRTILNGLPTPSYAITPPGLLGYQPPKVFDYNPERARKLLAEAGYPNGEGFPEFELQFNTSESHRKIAVAIQQMWKTKLNIDVRLQNKDWKVYLDSESTGDYEISRAGWIGDYVDPNTFLDMWVSGSGLNRTGWQNDEYDKLVLKTAPEAKTREARFAAFYKAEKILINDMPFIPIYTYSSHRYQHPSVQGLPSNLLSYYNYRSVSLDPNWQKATGANRHGGKQ